MCNLASTNPNYNPSTWDFQGSYDGQTWSTLDSQSGETNWVDSEIRIYECTAGDYNYYRLLITATVGGARPNIGLFELFDYSDFYDTSTHTHYDQAGNVIKRVYIGEFDVVSGKVSNVINYQHGTVCTIPVNDGNVLALSSYYSLDKPYLGYCSSQARIYHQNKWGKTGWCEQYVNSSKSYSEGTKSHITDGNLVCVTGTLNIGVSYIFSGGEFTTPTTTSSPVRGKVTVVREW